jgi:hypothetical protein
MHHPVHKTSRYAEFKLFDISLFPYFDGSILNLLHLTT